MAKFEERSVLRSVTINWNPLTGELEREVVSFEDQTLKDGVVIARDVKSGDLETEKARGFDLQKVLGKVNTDALEKCKEMEKKVKEAEAAAEEKVKASKSEAADRVRAAEEEAKRKVAEAEQSKNEMAEKLKKALAALT